MRKIRTILLVFLLLLPTISRADEGLWLIQDVKTAIGKEMRARGLKMPPKTIYDMDSPGSGAADAVVSLGNRYSGSFISDKGLLLTAGTPAASFVDKLGDVGKDLIKDGFWAVTEAHEIPVQGERVYSLRRVFDVTEEMKALKRELGDEQAAAHKLEGAYREASGLDCYLHVLWNGEKSYISVYKVYDDVRLVAMPPSGFGFSLYRVYENGRPASTSHSLEFSLDGGDKDSFASAIGFPALTRRYLSASEATLRDEVLFPITSAVGYSRLKILEEYMGSDPSVKAKYSARAARLKTVLDRNSALARTGERQQLSQKRKEFDSGLQDWIDAQPSFGGLWDGLVPELSGITQKMSEVESDKALRRETLTDGFYAGDYLRRAASSDNLQEAVGILRSAFQETDPDVEKALLAYSLSEYYTNLGNYYYGPLQKRLQDRFGYDWDAAADFLWSRSLLSSQARVSELESMDEILADPLLRFISEGAESEYDTRGGDLADKEKLESLRGEYLRARYWNVLRSDKPFYPDADGTMRLSYGVLDGEYTVPKDAIPSAGSRWQSAIAKDSWGRWGFTVGGKRHKMMTAFSCDCDFAEGMEGSPVLDAQCRLVGVVSSGKPSAAVCTDTYLEGETGSMCTDIHFVLWCIDRYGGMKRIMKELVIH